MHDRGQAMPLVVGVLAVVAVLVAALGVVAGHSIDAARARTAADAAALAGVEAGEAAAEALAHANGGVLVEFRTIEAGHRSPSSADVGSGRPDGSVGSPTGTRCPVRIVSAEPIRIVSPPPGLTKGVVHLRFRNRPVQFLDTYPCGISHLLANFKVQPRA